MSRKGVIPDMPELPRSRRTIWREMSGLTKRAAARRAGQSLPTYLHFEAERRDYLERARALCHAIGAAPLIVPPTSSMFQLGDVQMFGAEQYRALTLQMAGSCDEEERAACVRVLFALALSVAAPHAKSTIEATEALAQAIGGET